MTSNAKKRSTLFARAAHLGALPVLFVLLFVACGSPASTDSGTGVTDTVGDTGNGKLDAKDGLQDGTTPKDGTLTDVTTDPDSQTDDGDAFFVPDDLTVDVKDQVGADGSNGCDFPTNPAPGEPGSPCKTADECDNGFCVDAPNGKICTAACVSCCPAGFECGKMQGVDGAFACLPKQLALCQPCLTDAECGKVDPGALCITYGNDGAFCGTGCSGPADCPTDYACEDTEGQLGAAKQCVRKTGQCACTKWGALAGASTSCLTTNDAGSCKGSRKCGIGGLTACSAPAPVTETCNGVDDNCDGLTDPPNADGCTNYYNDNDGDGYGGGKGSCLCSDPGNGLTQGGDCNDQSTAIHPGTKEVCDGQDNDCDGKTDPGYPDANNDGFADCVDPDIDGDGVPNGSDCAPANAAIYPGAQESCDSLDNDCNGVTDDAGATGCTQWFQDVDGDGTGAGAGKCLCGAFGAYTSASGSDCNDLNKNIHVGATEICNDADDNCSGVIDEGCDDDLDLWCDATMTVIGTPAVCANGKQDCNDGAASIHPGQGEICGNGVDDNCDGLTDTGDNLTGCVNFYSDSDGDGYGNKALSSCLCAATSLYTTQLGGDCNDFDANVSPKAQEICNGKDDDCDGTVDGATASDCKLFFNDVDGDKFGVSTDQKCQCAAAGTYTATVGGDCNDNATAIRPNALEVCNGIDDNCDGITDPSNTQDCSPFFKDADGDNYGNYLAGSKCMCAAGNGYVAEGGDCDDANKDVHPNATEICNGLDDNCDNSIDPINTSGCTNFHLDTDGDNYGQTWSQCACAASALYTAFNGDDCDDTKASINPGAPEICDGQDNDCNGQTDEGVQVTYYLDSDTDGYGTGAGNAQCKATPGFSVLLNGDCNDANKDVHPFATETCNSVDDNCNGQTDEGAQPTTWYPDADGDGYGVPGTTKVSCTPQTGYAPNDTDCNDADAAVNPGHAEVCDSKDNNCNGQTDEGLPVGTYYLDADKDGYGTGSGQSGCGSAGGYTALLNTDCNDADASINPGGAEVCNSKDDNCNGSTDEGLTCNSCTATVVNPLNVKADFTAPSAIDWSMDSNNPAFVATSGTTYQYLRWGANNGCGYYSFNETANIPFNIPASANFVAIDVAFDNAAGSSPDPDLALKLDFDGVVKQIGPFSTLHAGTWFTVTWPVSASQLNTTGKKIIATTTSVTSNYSCTGGMALDNVRVIAGCTDLSNFCAPANVGGAQGTQSWYTDADGDGYGDAATAVTACFPQAGKVAVGGDCNDASATVHPTAAEIPCNGIDEDCNGVTDEGGALLNGFETSGSATQPGSWWVPEPYAHTQGSQGAWWGLSSGCGYSVNDNTSTFSITVPNGASAVGLDVFFDNRKTNSPEAPDTTVKMIVTLDGVKRQVGPFLTVQNPKWRTLMWPMTAANYGKTYTVSVQMTSTASNSTNGLTCVAGQMGGFAVDNARSITVCQGSQPTCTPGVTASTWFLDGDGDGFGDPATSVSGCIQPTGYIPNGGDCDDQNAAVNPGVAKDSCNTAAIDDNCDGVTDTTGSPTGCATMYPDADGDTFGSKTAASVCVCAGAPGYVASKTDCNDKDAAVNPNGVEVCDGVDNNCDGSTDPQNTSGCVTYFKDFDTDGYGLTADSQCWCSAHLTYTAIVGGDCADDKPAINPGKTETCNSVDDDCNTLIDDGLPQGTWYKDADGDKFGAAAPQFIGCQVVGYVADNTDCNDTAVSIYPGATETCNLKDDNCDGATDEGLNLGTWNRDADGDGFGDAGTQLMNSCMLPGYVATYGDCDDTKVAVNPGVAEVCYNKIDDNCDGATDEGCPTCVPTLVEGFNASSSKIVFGYAALTNWALSTSGFVPTEGSSYLRYGGTGGYYTSSASYDKVTVTFTVPQASPYLTLDYIFANATDSLYTPDKSLKVAFTFNGQTQTIGPFQTYQGLTPKQLSWPIPSNLYGTTQTLVILPTASGNGYVLSGIMVDNLRTTCN